MKLIDYCSVRSSSQQGEDHATTKLNTPCMNSMLEFSKRHVCNSLLMPNYQESISVYSKPNCHLNWKVEEVGFSYAIILNIFLSN